jgi:hypothetical protein
MKRLVLVLPVIMTTAAWAATATSLRPVLSSQTQAAVAAFDGKLLTELPWSHGSGGTERLREVLARLRRLAHGGL